MSHYKLVYKTSLFSILYSPAIYIYYSSTYHLAMSWQKAHSMACNNMSNGYHVYIMFSILCGERRRIKDQAAEKHVWCEKAQSLSKMKEK